MFECRSQAWSLQTVWKFCRCLSLAKIWESLGLVSNRQLNVMISSGKLISQSLSWLGLKTAGTMSLPRTTTALAVAGRHLEQSTSHSANNFAFAFTFANNWKLICSTNWTHSMKYDYWLRPYKVLLSFSNGHEISQLASGTRRNEGKTEVLVDNGT